MEVYGVAIVCGEGVALFGVIVAVPIIGDDVFVSCLGCGIRRYLSCNSGRCLFCCMRYGIRRCLSCVLIV